MEHACRERSRIILPIRIARRCRETCEKLISAYVICRSPTTIQRSISKRRFCVLSCNSVRSSSDVASRSVDLARPSRANPTFLPRHGVLHAVNPAGTERMEYRRSSWSRRKLPSSHDSRRAPPSITHPRSQVGGRSPFSLSVRIHLAFFAVNVVSLPSFFLSFCLSHVRTYVNAYFFRKFISPEREAKASVYDLSSRLRNCLPVAE